jgi:hypothetical protein
VLTPARTSLLAFGFPILVGLVAERGRAQINQTFNIDKYRQARSGQSYTYFMPALSGDTGRTTDGDQTTWTSLTELQYDRFVKWANGEFENERVDSYEDFSKIPRDKQPGTGAFPSLFCSFN